MTDSTKWLIWLVVFVVGSLGLAAAGYGAIVARFVVPLLFWILATCVVALIVTIKRRRK